MIGLNNSTGESIVDFKMRTEEPLGAYICGVLIIRTTVYPIKPKLIWPKIKKTKNSLPPLVLISIKR